MRSVVKRTPALLMFSILPIPRSEIPFPERHV
jgi:hypothetical protein